ncbi:MAG: MutS-related protein [Fusobacteriaceae bacterium]
MRFIDETSLERLKIKNLLNRIEPHSPYGREKLKKIIPFSREDSNKLKKEFETMECFFHFFEISPDVIKRITEIVYKLKDIRTIVKNIMENKNNILEDTDFFEIKIQGIIMEELQEVLKTLPQELNYFNLNSVSQIIDILDPQKDRIPTFYIYSYYSKKLSGVREKKSLLEKKIYENENLNEVEELKQKRLICVLDEEREELEVRKILQLKIQKYIIDFNENIEIIGELDFILSKVEFARKYGGIKPEISVNYEVNVKGLINLELKELLDLKGQKFTPIDIELKSGTTLITGANMGGKSVALKTITENLMLFHLGIFPLCREASFPIVDYIYFVSDDMQNLSKGLSTFGAEIIKLKEISIFLKQGKGFVVFDEFARGTNPEEGKKIVKSLAKFLNKKSSISILTTHFDGIANEDMKHYQVIGLKHVNFQGLKKTMILNKNSMSILQDYMDYRLEKKEDCIVPKYALNIATLLGMDDEFSKILEEEYREELE